MSENNRRISLHSALKRAKPIIRIVGEMDNPAMLSVAEALEPLKGTFDLQLTDGVQIDSYRSFLKTLATLPTN
ncbi:TPA: hypothetical protein DIS57_04650 [Candidatus Wolfebacteria bacterium]|nr:hypothetical protein [Candidatus Wolfebacteria bacterium]